MPHWKAPVTIFAANLALNRLDFVHVHSASIITPGRKMENQGQAFYRQFQFQTSYHAFWSLGRGQKGKGKFNDGKGRGHADALNVLA